MSDKPRNPMLEMLLRMTEIAEFSYQVTIHVDGQIICGEVVSKKTYVQALVDFMSKGLASALRRSPNLSEGDANRLADQIDGALRAASSAVNEEIDVNEISVDFIHLKSPVFISSPTSKLYTSEFPYWQIAIDDISGWTFGSP